MKSYNTLIINHLTGAAPI